MTHPAARRPSRTPAVLGGALLAAGLLLTACGGGAEADGAPADDVAAGDAAPGAVEAADDGALPGAPEECLSAFPLAVGGASLDDVDLVPADWPAAPDGSVLCGTGGTADGSSDYVEYAVPLAGEDLIAYYEAALPAGYSAERTDTVSGEGVSGTAGDVYFEVGPRDGGGVTILFAVA